jgi:1-acyl-sn-glycerol-3-phosphate acyltransferase
MPDKYKKIIALNDSYTTPKAAKNLPFWGSAIDFYSGFVPIIFRSSSLAKKGIYDDFKWVESSLDIMQRLEKAGVVFNITGMSNIIKHDGPVIFIGNHMSTLETVVLPSLIHPVKKVVFITKKELADYPVFGPVNSVRDPIIVGRENPREDLKTVMNEGQKRIENGKSIIIFPQKTRTKLFDSESFNSLGIKLAKKNKVPVVPIALLTDAWDNGKIIKEMGKIDISRIAHFEFGEPFFCRR